MEGGLFTGPSIPPNRELFYGCILEAERADRVATALDGLRTALNHSFHGHMLGVTEIIRQSSIHLRDLAFTPHTLTRILANDLNVVLPCISRTLRDITAHYENKALSREIRWKTMYHDMRKEAGGLPLPQRFLLYNRFITLLIFLRARDRRFDPAQLEQLRTKILDLRRLRGIPDPAQQQPPPIPPKVVITAPSMSVPIVQRLLVPRPQPADYPVVTVVQQPPRITEAQQQQQQRSPHWCERVFALFAAHTAASNTGPRASAERSAAVACSAALVPAHDPRRPVARRVLMRRAFDGNRFCVKFILVAAGRDEEPCVVLRAYNSGGEAVVAWKWHNDLVAARVGSATVVLRRWSESRGGWKAWVRLGLANWEELVLFYTAFVVLKARNPLSKGVNAAEYRLADEDVLFRGKIVDDGYEHTLTVNRDQRTGSMRLLTAVATGELAQCPVWTAFTGPAPVHLESIASSRHLVRVEGIRLFVFCTRYREARMRQNRTGAFEIYFVSELAADDFMYVFQRADQAPAPPEPPQAQERIAGPSSSQ